MSGPTKPGLVGRLHHFLCGGAWHVDLAAHSWWQRGALLTVRTVWSVFKGFERHVGTLHASALTYYTLLAIVPVLALSLALARVFGGEEIARRQIDSHVVSWISGEVSDAAPPASVVPPAPGGTDDPGLALASRLLTLEDKLFRQINRISLGTLGGVGLAGLLWLVIGILGRIEASFNAVWGVPRGRSLWRCFTDYLSVVLIVPLLIVAASTVPVADLIARHAAVAGVAAGSIKSVVGSLLAKRVIVLAFATLAFTFLLIFMPNTRVRVVPGVVGGLITAVCFTVWMKICTVMQVGIVKYSLLYGSFALLPIVLAWVYVSWEIVLLGAEIVCTLQLGAVCPADLRGRQSSPRSRLVLALTLCAAAVRAVRESRAPFDAEAFLTSRRLPARLVRDLLDDLKSAGLLAEVASQPGCYLPCRDADRLTVADVARCILDDGLSPEDLGMYRLDAQAVAVAHDFEQEMDRVLGRPVVAS